MEQNRIDLKKIEEETKGKVAAVNSQKVTIVKDIVASTKVSRRFCFFSCSLPCSGFRLTPNPYLCTLLSAAESQADHGEGVPGSGHGGPVGREDQAGEGLQGRGLPAQIHGSKGATDAERRTAPWDAAALTGPCVLAAKMQPAGAEEGPADGTVQNHSEESDVHLQHAR